MYEPEDEELERIKREKLKRMIEAQRARKSLQEQLRELEKAEKAEMVKKMIFLRYVDEDVRDRIANIRLVNPEFANMIESYILTLLKSGRVTRIDFEIFKKIVAALEERK